MKEKKLKERCLSPFGKAAIIEHNRKSGVKATEVYFSQFWSLGGPR